MRPPALAVLAGANCQHAANIANNILGKVPSKIFLDNARKSLTLYSLQSRSATNKVFCMLNFLEIAARVVAGLVVAAVLVACMLAYFDVLVA